MAIETLAPDRSGSTPVPGPIVAGWLGRVDYREALALQKELAADRASGRIPDQLLLLEHPAVLTLGRHADPGHIRATPAVLAARGIDLVQVERGGEVTYHGPGQLVAYPIIHLAERGILVRPMVRALEAAMAETCAALGVAAGPRAGYPGCWCDPDGADPRKIGALGLRVERGVTYHGIALNVTTDLREFEMIDPCGMPDIRSTSVAVERGDAGAPPSTSSVRHAGLAFAAALGRALGADIQGP